jgi:iron(III) transport system permease protein
VFAYVVRFLIIALSNVGDGMDKIPVSLDHVSRTLGRSPFRAFWEIQLPLLKPAIIAAGLLVMVDSMKELPATLILRPFDFDTLATRIFSLASLGQYESAAIPALAIVMAGLLPVIVLSKSFKSAEDS